MMMRTDLFRDLTWGDLIVWAGKDIVNSGRKVQFEGRVKKLSITPTEGLIAWVDAEDLYATRVEYDGSELVSDCTCNQIDITCSHSIAVIIDYIVLLKKKLTIPYAKSNDRRFFLL